MNTFHVIALIPSTWKAVVVVGSLTSREFAKIWIDPVVVHSVHFTLMSKQAGIGRETEAPAVVVLGYMLAGIRLQVGVQVLPK